MIIQICTDDIKACKELLPYIRFYWKNERIFFSNIEDFDSQEMIKEQNQFVLLLILYESSHRKVVSCIKQIEKNTYNPFLFISPLLSEREFGSLTVGGPYYYLPYPFRDDDMLRVLANLKGRMENSGFSERPLYARIWISVKKGEYEGINVSDILYIQASDHYLVIKLTHGHKPIVFKSALSRFFKDELAHYPMFFMLSRSYVINLDMANRIGDNQIFLEKERLTIPRNRKEELIARLFNN